MATIASCACMGAGFTDFACIPGVAGRLPG